ncbi:MAG: hypothetical protein F6J90_41650 [Moorea sp. SIOASIH]|uniref:hypothetical protein n=1 Tax=Moorena sp. SIOASIH TaxID=2607817 RepID=UPI0013B748D2|nr:hypothetical protein [Moorena sp. SIOASIH]NEO42479.1 hypothetical protein [Moorena sp. SIOASIH]
MPRANNLPFGNAKGEQLSTYPSGTPKANNCQPTLRERQRRTTFNLQPWPKGHATPTTVKK